MTAPAPSEPGAGTLVALNRLRAAGFTLELDGPDLMVSPADRLTEKQRAYIRDHKPALVQLLEDKNAQPLPGPVTVCCSDCRHARPATPGDPWSWHLCAAGVEREHGWGMMARKCERWLGK